MPKITKPTGKLIEEYVCVSHHFVVDGVIIDHINDIDGEYTGRFYWVYPDGRYTKMYTRKTAPKWLREIRDSLFNFV